MLRHDSDSWVVTTVRRLSVQDLGGVTSGDARSSGMRRRVWCSVYSVARKYSGLI